MLEGLLVGLASGIICSAMIWGFSKTIRPKIKISENMAQRCIKNSDNIECRVKFYNRSRWVLKVIEYKLYFAQVNNYNQSVGITDVKPRFDPITAVSKHTKEAPFEHAVQIIYDVPPNLYPNQQEQYFLFSITVQHGLTGTTKTIQKRYHPSQILKGTFAVGDSTSINAFQDTERQSP